MHRTIHVQRTITIAGASHDVDEGIASDIAAMNERGIRTWVSCQGDGSGPGIGIAYLGLCENTGPARAVVYAARAAGFSVRVDGRGPALYSSPADHQAAVRDVATRDDVIAWNAAFRRFLHDVAAGTVDATGDAYRYSCPIHPAEVDNDGCVDHSLLAAKRRWIAEGGRLEELCAGDQDLFPDGRSAVVRPHARWTPPHGGVPADLAAALEALHFEVHGWGAYTTRGLANSAHSLLVSVSRERVIGTARAFHDVFMDYGNGAVAEAKEYRRRANLYTRRIKRAAERSTISDESRSVS